MAIKLYGLSNVKELDAVAIKLFCLENLEELDATSLTKFLSEAVSVWTRQQHYIKDQKHEGLWQFLN